MAQVPGSPPPRLLIQEAWEWGLRTCISSKFPDDTYTVGGWVILCKPLPQRNAREGQIPDPDGGYASVGGRWD